VCALEDGDPEQLSAVSGRVAALAHCVTKELYAIV
jgi:hypothetical protein